MKELIYGQQLLERTEWYADKVGFIDGAYRGTYAQHMDRVLRLCGAMRELGLKKDDRFAVMALNSHQFLELYHAAFLGAGVINPLNLRLALPELEYILKDSGTKVCFVDAFFSGMVDQVRKATGIEKVVLIGEGTMPPEIKFDLRMEELIGATPPQLPKEPEENDPVVLMYTGGTTGLPKGVYLEQRAEMLNLLHATAVWLLLPGQGLVGLEVDRDGLDCHALIMHWRVPEVKTLLIAGPQRPVEELRHLPVEMPARGAAEAVLLVRVDRLLERLAGLDQRVGHRDRVLGMDVVVAGAVDDEESVGELAGVGHR
jgi:acyl-CoA synthetase (AMP-forming)/AMP-acid ligase II